MIKTGRFQTIQNVKNNQGYFKVSSVTDSQSYRCRKVQYFTPLLADVQQNFAHNGKKYCKYKTVFLLNVTSEVEIGHIVTHSSTVGSLTFISPNVLFPSVIDQGAQSCQGEWLKPSVGHLCLYNMSQEQERTVSNSLQDL